MHKLTRMRLISRSEMRPACRITLRIRKPRHLRILQRRRRPGKRMIAVLPLRSPARDAASDPRAANAIVLGPLRTLTYH